jgi:hypothetical protein
MPIINSLSDSIAEPTFGDRLQPMGPSASLKNKHFLSNVAAGQLEDRS